MLNLLKRFTNKNNSITSYNKFNVLPSSEAKALTMDDTNLDKREKIGATKHYPPATKEWVNSTYTYNKNYNKTLPVTDNVVNKLIKGYLTMNPLVNNKKSKRVVIRFKRLSLNKILVSKAEMKHTNDKVIITVYLYNRNKKFILHKLKNFSAFDLNKTLYLNNRKNKSSILTKKEKDLKSLTFKSGYLKRKIKFISLRAVNLINKAKKQKNLLFKTLNWDNSNFLIYKNRYYKNFTKKAYEIELLYMYYVKMLSLNNNKFKNWFLLGLKNTISKLYNKKVEFNFVNLKYLHLNSDIFTESIVTRIRNRKNPIALVLNRALRLANIPSKNYNLDYNTINSNSVILHNKSKAFPRNTLLNIINAPSIKHPTNDILHTLLYNIFTQNHQNLKTFGHDDCLLESNKLNNKQRNILDGIKYKTVLGVRLEAAGRLSKRLTASRSVFKLKYKGGLKNIDSSRRGLSSVILRGNTNSNVQYTLINNKTRNGSFGLKGWISGQ